MPELDPFESFLRWMRPAWQRDALCQEYLAVNFFPERGESTSPAKAVCRRCLVREECLAFALASVERHGIWGGLSERERRKVRTTQREAA